jgi:hypothetical protein
MAANELLGVLCEAPGPVVTCNTLRHTTCTHLGGSRQSRSLACPYKFIPSPVQFFSLLPRPLLPHLLTVLMNHTGIYAPSAIELSRLNPLDVPKCLRLHTEARLTSPPQRRPCNRGVRQKPAFPQLGTKFSRNPKVHYHIHNSPAHSTSVISSLILSSHPPPGLPNGLPFRLPHANSLYFSPPPQCVNYAPPTLCSFISST